jgi:diacylglycerol kinase (ATP)
MINLKVLKKSFGFAFEGVAHAFKYDQNLRIHFIVAFFVILASLFFKVTPFEAGILGIAILLVIATEMINTAIENMIDLITKEYHVEAKIAKDVSSGMVLITAIGSVLVGALVFTPYVVRFFSH